jgi:hypothetical protein
MTRVPATFRSISLPGVFAAAAVVLVLGLLSAAPCLAAEAGTPPTPTTSCLQPRASADDRAGEAAPSVACRHESPPSGEALRQNHATDRGVVSRHTEPGLRLVPRPGTAGVELPAWLALFRGRLPAAARPLLHVLYCTWLA